MAAIKEIKTKGRNKGLVILLSAPSGAGKDTILSRALEICPNLWKSVSVTTRPRREGELEGGDYRFIGKVEFDGMVRNHELLEHTEFVGNGYGTPKKPFLDRIEQGIDVVLKIEVEGAARIKKIFPEAVSIFVLPPSAEELERRLRERATEPEDKITQRVNRAKIEMTFAKTYDYIIVNDSLEEAVADFLHIYRAEQLAVRHALA
jgi:guanylate kinase